MTTETLESLQGARLDKEADAKRLFWRGVRALSPLHDVVADIIEVRDSGEADAIVTLDDLVDKAERVIMGEDDGD